MSLAADLEIGDSRVEFVADYVLKTMKLKGDKWTKMYSVDENKQMFIDFFEKSDHQSLMISLNSSGNLLISFTWPSALKSKACYFVKKGKENVQKDASIRSALFYGDLSYTPIDQLSAFVDEVLCPLLSNEKNHDQWPHVVSQDVRRHVHSLKSSVYVVSGQVKGKTLLPLPVGAEKIEDQAEEIEKPEVYDRALVHAIESVIIDWTHQIKEVLKKDSAQPLLEGLNPTPFVEVEFWKAKAQNLECIYDQLRDPKVRKMAELLEKANSSYFPSFKNIFRDVVAALTEAQDINMHLKPLKDHFEDLEGAEFDEAHKLFPPLMHVISLIWANSQYYNSPGRIVVLLQEVCNLLINMCGNYLEPTEIFKGESEETIEKVQKAMKTLHSFKEVYAEHKAKLKDYFKEGEPKEWEFAPQLVFHRYDKFVERVEMVNELFETVLEFMKLEKIEFGGIKGKILSSQTFQIFEEFNALYKVFQEKSYDCLDPQDTEFLEDANNFKAAIADLDRRLSSIVCQGFDDCSALEAVFKLLDIFGSLLERPLIKQDFNCNYPKVVTMMDESLAEAKRIYDHHMAIKEECGHFPMHKNMAKVSGSLKWAMELKARIQTPMANFKHLEHPCMESQEAKDVFTHYEKLLEILSQFEAEVYAEWTTGVDEACSFNLDQPLISRNEETKLIIVNFDPQLVAVLREVHYLEIRGGENIPESAATLYSKNDTLRKYTANIDLTVQWYNKIRETVIEVEYPLIEGQLADIDSQLEKAEKDLNWTGDGIWEYIEQTRDMVHDLESRIQKTKNNVEQIQKIMATWSKLPLFERKEGKHESLLNLDDRNDRLKKRYNEVAGAGDKIHGLLNDNKELFKAEADSDNWKAYVDYVDEMVVDGFFSMIRYSLQFMLDNTDAKCEMDPLFEAHMELLVQDMIFNPSLDAGVADGFYDLIDGLVGDIYKQSAKINRLAAHSGQEHYQPDLEEMEELSDMRQELMERIQNIMNKACDYRNSFENYSYLWMDDRAEFMRQFLLYNHVLTTEEIEAHAEDGVPECPPTLDQFKEQIDTYEKIYEEVEAIDGTTVFDSWFRVDGRPFRQSLLNIIKKWSFMFKQHLIDHVTNSLKDLQEFIKLADNGLTKPVEEGDYNGLVECMGHLMAVKERQSTTDEMFEPLKHTIELLKNYDQEMPEEVHLQLQELPEQWNNSKKKKVPTATLR